MKNIPSAFLTAIASSLSLLLLFAFAESGLAQVLYENDFDQYTTERVYTEADLDADWNTPTFNDGVTEGRVTIVGPTEAHGGTGSALAVFYPAGMDGTKDTGAQWKLELDGEYEEVILSYRVKFKNGFDFVRGGKLPGLAGGTAPSGNAPADGANGWTGRMMWRTSFTGVSGNPQQLVSQAISYAKYVDSGFNMDGRDEDKIYWIDGNGDQIQIESDRWYQIKQRVKMNQPGQSDGILQIWLDDELVHDQQDVLFRTVGELSIDQMFFSTFFGGNEDWATSKDETVYFDDFSIYQPTEPRFIKVPGHYDTIQAAIDAALPGDTVAVRESHRENIVVDKAIFLRGYTGTRITAVDRTQPVIRVTAANAHVKRFIARYGSESVLVEAGNENVKVEFIRSFFADSAGIRLEPGCHGAWISKNVINRGEGDGIVIAGSNDSSLINNRLLSSPGVAMMVSNGDRCTVEGNVAFDNGMGFSVSGSENKVLDNVGYNNVGIGFEVLGDNHEVVDNYSRLNGSHGFSFFSATNNHVAENQSKNDGGNGFQFLMISDGNTIVDNSARFGGGIGFFVDFSTGNNFDDNWADDNLDGFVLTETTTSTSVTNCRSEDNANFGFLDMGTANTLSGNISRRNGTN